MLCFIGDLRISTFCSVASRSDLMGLGEWGPEASVKSGAEIPTLKHRGWGTLRKKHGVRDLCFGAIRIVGFVMFYCCLEDF